MTRRRRGVYGGSAAPSRGYLEPVTAAEVCLDCATSSAGICRFHRGEESAKIAAELTGLRPPMVDPATAINARRLRTEYYRRNPWWKSKDLWFYVAVVAGVVAFNIVVGLLAYT